nr:RNA-directed DNA polymerase, eukaryota [Tanacetum cinerariifolium]
MGTLVDVYIAKRKNHLGQMFAFCRYIKVSDSKTLIDSLSYVWIGKLSLHANVARFDRNVVSKPSHAGKHKIVADSARTIVLDDECIMERDLSCTLMGKIKDINDLSNLYELKAWSLDFNNEFCEDSSSDDESVDKEVDHVSDTHNNGADFDKEKEAALLDREATYEKRKDFILDSTGTNDKGDDDLDKEKKDDYVKSSSDMNVNGAVLTIMAKIHWAIEGYENSRYFYGIINKKRSQLVIRGVLVDKERINDPSKVKNEFLNHFSNQFSKPTAHVMSLDPQMFKRLSPEQNVDLESNVTYEEITKAIWDCGTNKSPGPDGFTFDFFRKYWKTIDLDVVNAVQDFFITSKFPPGSNSTRKMNVHLTAILIGCFTFTMPFTYLSVKVGTSTSRSSSWDEALYGDRGSLDNPCYTSCRSLWYNIIREFKTLSLKGINLQSHMKKKVGNGVHTLFWEDPYLNDLPLMNVFLRLYTLECDKKVTVAMKLTDCYVIDSFRRPPRGGIEEDQLSLLVDKLAPVIFTDSNDKWIWSIDSAGEFSVKSA